MRAAGGQTLVAKKDAGIVPSEGSTTRAKGRSASVGEMAISKTTSGVGETTSKVCEMPSREAESQAAKATSESRHVSDGAFGEMSESGPVLVGRAMGGSRAPCPCVAVEVVVASANGVPKDGRATATAAMAHPSTNGIAMPKGPTGRESLKTLVSPISLLSMSIAAITAGLKTGLLCPASERAATAAVSPTSPGS